MVGPMATALVTGASRGIGRGIAISLGEAGHTVYVTGRSTGPADRAETVDRTAGEVTRAGGVGIAVVCDHHDDQQLAALFEQIETDSGALDLLVNNVFSSPALRSFGDDPFFDQPVEIIDEMLSVGLRTHYVATWKAVQLMRKQTSGLVVNISSAGAAYSVLSPSYCIAKAGLDKFTVDGAKQLKPLNITMVSLWPGPLVDTEFVRQTNPDAAEEVTESPFLTGRAVAALFHDPEVARLTGRELVSADLAEFYDFTDADEHVRPYPFDDQQTQRQLLRRAPLRVATRS
jgi:dehydrogenase/reductase SDR family protein 1